MDTTGTVWPERQKFLNEKGISVDAEDLSSKKSFGMNWKMTLKTSSFKCITRARHLKI